MLKSCVNTCCFMAIGLFSLQAEAECANGQPISIPTADTSKPGISLWFEYPSGQIVTVTKRSMPQKIFVPSGSEIQVTAMARDLQGVKDIELYVGTKNCTRNPNTQSITCAGPGLQGGPTAQNHDWGLAGEKGCTVRIVILKLIPILDDTKSRSFEISARAINFGDLEETLGIINVEGVKPRAPPSAPCPITERCCGFIDNNSRCVGDCWPANRACPIPN